MPDIYSTELKITPKFIGFVSGYDNVTEMTVTHLGQPLDLSDFTFEMEGLSVTPITDGNSFAGTNNGKLYIKGLLVTEVGEKQDFVLKGSSPTYGNILLIHPSITSLRVRATVVSGS